MRRIYHRFPQQIDLDFELGQPFQKILSCLVRLHDTHTTSKGSEGLIKERVLIQVAERRTQFLDLDELSAPSESISEIADFRITFQRTLLTPAKRLPIAENVFYLRIVDRGQITECYAAKESLHGDIDSMDLRRLLKGACE